MDKDIFIGPANIEINNTNAMTPPLLHLPATEGEESRRGQKNLKSCLKVIFYCLHYQTHN